MHDYLFYICFLYERFDGNTFQKMILFTKDNNKIIKQKLLHLKLHLKHRRFYHIINIDPFHTLLQNEDNCTDIIFAKNLDPKFFFFYD